MSSTSESTSTFDVGTPDTLCSNLVPETPEDNSFWAAGLVVQGWDQHWPVTTTIIGDFDTPTERKWFECWCNVDPWDYLILDNNHNIFIPGLQHQAEVYGTTTLVGTSWIELTERAFKYYILGKSSIVFLTFLF
jgi:hypothetical protein